METPSCQRCHTDKYLRILSYVEGYTEQVPFRTGHGTIYKTRTTAPEAQFFCQSCGAFNGHSVPESWVPPEETSVPSELAERGDFWSDPHTHWTRQEDGGWSGTAKG